MKSHSYLDYCYYLPHPPPPLTHTLTRCADIQGVRILLENFTRANLPPSARLLKLWDEDLEGVLSTAYCSEDDDDKYDNHFPVITDSMDLLAGLGASLDRIVRRRDFILKHLQIGTFTAARQNTMGGRVSLVLRLGY